MEPVLPVKRLSDCLLRRAVLRGVADGKTISRISEELGISKTSIHRYGVAFPRFFERVQAAREMIGYSPEQVARFLDGEPIEEPGSLEQRPPPALERSEAQRTALLGRVIEIEAGVARADGGPVVIDPDVLGAPASAKASAGPQIPRRSVEAFYDKMWLDAHNPHISDARVIASSRILHQYYDTQSKRNALIQVEMARQGGGSISGERPRGLTKQALSRTIHSIIGPPPDDESSEGEGVA